MQIEISKNRLRLLLYLAHKGHGVCREDEYRYKENFPTRKPPFEKLLEIEDDLHKQGFCRY